MQAGGIKAFRVFCTFSYVYKASAISHASLVSLSSVFLSVLASPSFIGKGSPRMFCFPFYLSLVPPISFRFLAFSSFLLLIQMPVGAISFRL